MKNKGFTLIELLAVIVVLAIIALIATPIIMNIIGNIQEGANARSVEGYMRAYEAKYYAEYAATGKAPDLSFVTLTTGDYNGASVECGNTIKIVDGKFKATCTVNNQVFNYEGGKATKTSKGNIPSIPLGKVCTLVEGTAKTVGAKYVCNTGDGLKNFYILEINSSNNEISLILDENIDNDTVAWCSSECSIQAGTVLEMLAQKTSNWDSSLNITLPTAQQIAKAGENKGWNPGRESGKQLPSWLYENIYLHSTNPGLTFGYWTSTIYEGMDGFAWRVDTTGLLRSAGQANDEFNGIRPVIVVDESKI